MLCEGKNSNSTAHWGTSYKPSTCEQGTQLSTCALGSLIPLCQLLPIFTVHFKPGRGFLNDVHFFLNDGSKICWSNGQMPHVKPLLANSEMLNVNKTTVQATLPERDKLIQFFLRYRGN